MPCGASAAGPLAAGAPGGGAPGKGPQKGNMPGGGNPGSMPMATESRGQNIGHDEAGDIGS